MNHIINNGRKVFVPADVWSHGHSRICAVPHCNEPVETCFRHSCPLCGVPKSSKLLTCPNCTVSGVAGGFAPGTRTPVPFNPSLPLLPELSVVRLHRKFETQHSVLFQSLYDGVSVIEKVPMSPENVRALLLEAELHVLVDRHPNVTRNFGVCQRSSGEISMIVEQLEGDLTERLNSMRQQEDAAPETWGPSLALYAVQLARGLRHLHQHGLVHRDICANNVLTDGELVKVSDFGLAKRVADLAPSGLPYPLTTAPEVLRNMNDTSIWTQKADVWQYGLFLCEVFSFGSNPLREFNVSVSALLEALDRQWLPPRPDFCPDALWRIVLLCTEQDHHVRPDMEVVVPLMEAFSASLAAPK